MQEGALVIGYGNPLRGDDAVGLEIANGLAAASRDGSFEVLALPQLVPELSALISEVGLVIFIDSSHMGRPGNWACEVVEPDATSLHTLGHHLTPASLLAYTQALCKTSPRALLVSVAGESFDFGQELSPTVANVLPAVEQFVRETVTRMPPVNFRRSTGGTPIPPARARFRPSRTSRMIWLAANRSTSMAVH